MKWYIKVLKQYADFSGRARRKEYWMFVLFNLILFILFAFIDITADLIPKELLRAGVPYGVFTLTYLWLVMIPSLAVGVRRLHDTGRSGWFIFVVFIPLIGSIWLLVLMLKEGEHNENRYGASPKTEVTGWDSTKNSANAFILASVASFFAFAANLFNMWEIFGGLSIQNYISILYPLGLLIIGIFLRQGDREHPNLPHILIGYAVFFLLMDIIPMFRSIAHINLFFTGFRIASLLKAAGLLLIGTRLIQKKDVAIAPTLLITGACLAILTSLANDVQFVHSYNSPFVFLIGHMSIISNAAFIIFGYLLLQKDYAVTPQIAPQEILQEAKQVHIPKQETPITPPKTTYTTTPTTGKFPIYSGTGVCDVCNRPLSGIKAFIVPNHVFYNSTAYRNYLMHTFGWGYTQIEMMRMQDQSQGSAVCEKCIYMFE